MKIQSGKKFDKHFAKRIRPNAKLLRQFTKRLKLYIKKSIKNILFYLTSAPTTKFIDLSKYIKPPQVRFPKFLRFLPSLPTLKTTLRPYPPASPVAITS